MQGAGADRHECPLRPCNYIGGIGGGFAFPNDQNTSDSEEGDDGDDWHLTTVRTKPSRTLHSTVAHFVQQYGTV